MEKEKNKMLNTKSCIILFLASAAIAAGCLPEAPPGQDTSSGRDDLRQYVEQTTITPRQEENGGDRLIEFGDYAPQDSDELDIFSVSLDGITVENSRTCPGTAMVLKNLALGVHALTIRVRVAEHGNQNNPKDASVYFRLPVSMDFLGDAKLSGGRVMKQDQQYEEGSFSSSQLLSPPLAEGDSISLNVFNSDRALSTTEREEIDATINEECTSVIDASGG